MGSSHNISTNTTVHESRYSTTNKLLISSVVFFFLHLLMNIPLIIYVTIRLYVIQNFSNTPSYTMYFTGAFFALMATILGIIAYNQEKDNLQPFYKRKIRLLLWLLIFYSFFVCIMDDILLLLILGIAGLIVAKDFSYYDGSSNFMENYNWIFGDTPKNIVTFVLLIFLILLFISFSKDSEKTVKQLITPYFLFPLLIFTVFASYDISWDGAVGLLPFYLLPQYQYDFIGFSNFFAITIFSIVLLTEVVIKFKKLDKEILH